LSSAFARRAIGSAAFSSASLNRGGAGDRLQRRWHWLQLHQSWLGVPQVFSLETSGTSAQRLDRRSRHWLQPALLIAPDESDCSSRHSSAPNRQKSQPVRQSCVQPKVFGVQSQAGTTSARCCWIKRRRWRPWHAAALFKLGHLCPTMGAMKTR